MARYNVAHDSYQAFRNATLGHAYDMDGYPASQPYQCWDFVDLLYEQDDVGQYLSTDNTGNVKDCWLRTAARSRNGSGHFVAVSGVTNIKRGDIIVFNTESGWYGSTGHIGFADEDYKNSAYINILSQNFYGKHYAAVDSAYLGRAFLGIFRYIPWSETPPTPPSPERKKRKKKFPWVIAWAHWDW